MDQLALLKNFKQSWDVGVVQSVLSLMLSVFPLGHYGLSKLAQNGRFDLVVHNDSALLMVCFYKASLDLAAHVSCLGLHDEQAASTALCTRPFV